MADAILMLMQHDELPEPSDNRHSITARLCAFNSWAAIISPIHRRKERKLEFARYLRTEVRAPLVSDQSNKYVSTVVTAGSLSFGGVSSSIVVTR